MKTTRTTTSATNSQPVGKYTKLTGTFAKVTVSYGKDLRNQKVLVASESGETKELGGQNVQFAEALFGQSMTSLVAVLSGPNKGFWVRIS